MTAAATEPTTTEAPPAELPPADRFMLRVLRLPLAPEPSATGQDKAQSAFQTSIVISGLRCLLTYIVLPFIAPFVGLAASINAPLGIFVALVAMVSIIASMRRFFGSRHRRRWAYATLGGLMFGFLIVTLIIDINSL